MNDWIGEPDRERWTDPATGIECVIQRHTSLKHLCGYVGLPKSHPWHGKGYILSIEMMDGDYVRVHGGLTYTSDHEPTGKPDGLWWLGFDCAHCGDYSPGMRGDREGRDETYKNWAYVKMEVVNLAGQAKRHADAIAAACV